MTSHRLVESWSLMGYSTVIPPTVHGNTKTVSPKYSKRICRFRTDIRISLEAKFCIRFSIIAHRGLAKLQANTVKVAKFLSAVQRKIQLQAFETGEIESIPPPLFLLQLNGQ